MPQAGQRESRTSPRRITAVDKQRQALELRMAGATFRQIADQLGYKGPQGAQFAVEAALDKTIREPADRLRELDARRLDSLLLTYWPMAKGGNMDALDRVLRILQRRAKLLGLDLPVVDPSRTDIDVAVRVDVSAVNAQLIAKMERMAGPPEGDGWEIPSIQGPDVP